MPRGLSANQTTGVISGTPDASTAPSTTGVTLTAKNAAGTGSATMVLTIQAAAPAATAAVLLGNQTIQSTVDSVSTGIAEAFQTTALASGAVSNLSVYVDGSSTATTLIAGLYKDAGGHPGALVSQGALNQVRPGAWNKVSIPGAKVAAGAKYWVAILSAKQGTLKFRDGTGCNSETSVQSSLTSLPTSWSTGAVWDSCNVSAFGSTM